MAEEDSAQEKTEEPTPKRQEKAREEGQTARSKDLTTFAVLIASTMGLFLFGGLMADALARVLVTNFSFSRDLIFDTELMVAQLGASFATALLSMLPFFACVVVAALVGPTAIGGMLFSSKALAPKWNRLDPIAGIKRMFSLNSLVELAKGIAKVSLIIAIAYVLLLSMKSELLGLSRETTEAGVAHALSLSLWAAIFLASATVMIAMIDVPYQMWQHKKKLRMSRQDIKDELKDTEGKPEVKSKVRQMQMQMAQNRMMSEVPEADVVITNPTHFSVALKYNPESSGAPIVIAKGVDLIALKIREIAKANDIEFVESPALARSIYHTTDIEQEVPEGLYVAVAQVLAYVFQLRQFRKGQGARPYYVANPDIPPDLRY